MKKLLASIGIGSAKVDTIIYNHEVLVGGHITGEIQITGGSVAQEINKIDLSLYTYVEDKNDSNIKRDYHFGTAHISADFVIAPNTTKVLPFSLDIPQYTPISASGYNRVWLTTSLDISSAIDPKDTDHLNIVPLSAMVSVFEALDDLGFSLYEIDVEQSRFFEWGFVQEFEFRPRSRRSDVHELEVIFYTTSDFLRVFVQKDTRVSHYLEEILDIDSLSNKMYSFDIPLIDNNIANMPTSEIRGYIANYIL